MRGAVGVLIGMDAHALCAGEVDLVQQFLGPSPLRLTHQLEVRDLEPDAGLAGDGDHLVEGFKHTGVLVAHVDGQQFAA